MRFGRFTASGSLVELGAIGVFAALFAAPALDFDPNVLPSLGEFVSAIQPYHTWTRLKACGVCALWNGSVRGGYPAFSDVHASLLHPIMAVPVLLFGVTSGVKVALAGALAMAGCAQWWLAKVLGLGRTARVWSGAMAVVAGNLAGRIEGGWINLIVSTAACALVIPPLVAWYRGGSGRDVVFLGVTFGLALVAGQGYMQLALGVFVLVAVALALQSRSVSRPELQRLALSLGLGILLAAPFLVPLAHFMPNLQKVTDPGFDAAQSFKYIPLNLVIDDIEFHHTRALEKRDFPGLNVNFIGWIPVLLATFGFAIAMRSRSGSDKQERRTAIFLGLSALVAIWLASAVPLKLTLSVLPAGRLFDFVAGYRNSPIFAGMAVAPLLGLAAIGVEHALHRDTVWPSISIRGAQREARFDLRWLMALVLILAVFQSWRFSRIWLRSHELPGDSDVVVQQLQTEGLQWVSTPEGVHAYLEPAMRAGLKVAPDFRPWFWKGRENPKPMYEASHYDLSHIDELSFVSQHAGTRIYRGDVEREYAVVEHPDGEKTVCLATGVGANIDVQCDAPKKGRLVIREHSAPGWRASVDGQRVALEREPWITVPINEGAETVTFRYRPWDVPLGVVLWLVGVGLSVALWRRDWSDVSGLD